ncbi:TetR family transcriptional regulator [Nonomuraea phyllanthi]|uniref:TetR/AcrR family transcriptional regulator n=1 Tax=Nonomuraea phyllanthi TaxID=2219224 RepID=UPI00129398E5|nr:TetR/AcrR family transcriptional regulator [Nonomuraea phyllanthi]QFY09764.1 TetR family transcriptional regulator [Nonomuraea phyllanthi]
MEESRERPHDDLTARARIRDAALAQFAKRGVKSARLQDIAEAAGVSVGLVQHHYGTKDGLREACDKHVRDVVLGAAEQVREEADVSPEFLRGMYDASELSVRYLARALVEGSPVAAALFDEGAEAAERFFAETWPEEFSPGEAKVRERAVVMAAMHLGTIVLHEHLSRRLGVDVLQRANAGLIGSALADVYAHMGEWAAAEQGARLRRAVTDFHAKEHPDA